MFPLIKLLSQRIVVLDGAMGTMLQRYGFEADDGYDKLSLSRPDVIGDIHRQYLEAGADIISTNTFCAGLSEHVSEICAAASRIARTEADRYMAGHPGRQIFVAGTIGPGSRCESQIAALVNGGCDLLLFETVYDAAMLAEGLTAAEKIAIKTGVRTPIMVSATIDTHTNCIRSGEPVAALWQSISRFGDVISFGLNCSSGSAKMRPSIAVLSATCDRFVSCHPNAGLPDKDRHYSESPAAFADNMAAMLSKGELNIIGGCCGTTPDHIRALSRLAAQYPPRQLR